MSDKATRDAAIMEMRKAITGILNIAVNEISDNAKIMLAQILQADPGSLRLHIQLEPLVIMAAVFAPDRKTPPVKLFEIHDAGPSGETH
jgi:hypothetical protein